MRDQIPEIPVRFFRTAAGGEPVLDWLRSLNKGDRQTVGLDLMRVQFAWPIGMPLVRNVGNGLWEVRSTLHGDRIARLIFCFHDDTLVIVNGFIKKTRKTPGSEIQLAQRRMKELTR